MVKVLLATATSVVGGIALRERRLERYAVDVRDHVHVDSREVARQRIHRQRRPERRAADADVDQVADLAECTLVNRLDQQLHPLAQRGGFLHARVLAHAAQRRVLGAAVLGRVDHFAGEQLTPLLGKTGRVGLSLERRQQSIGQMGLRPVEQHPAFRQFEPGRKPGHAIRVRGEQFGQRLVRKAEDRSRVFSLSYSPLPPG